jgi:hypothetical protein
MTPVIIITIFTLIILIIDLQEDAVMVTPCGHSFSTSSITAWLRQQGSSTKVCPVCKSTINESLIPNWALRNAVDRYTPYRVVMTTLCREIWG